MKLEDQALTEAGLAPEGDGKVLVLGCGALAREIRAVLTQAGLGHVDLA